MRLADLILGRDGEQIETFHLVLTRANIQELPVPENSVTAGDQNLDAVNLLRGWCTEDAGDPFGFAAERDAAELEETSEYSFTVRYLGP